MDGYLWMGPSIEHLTVLIIGAPPKDNGEKEEEADVQIPSFGRSHKYCQT